MTDAKVERDGETAEFRVRPRESAAGNVLVAMGFQPKQDAFARSFVDSDDVPRVFGNFSAHIDEMIRCTSGEMRPRWERALELVDERLTGHVDGGSPEAPLSQSAASTSLRATSILLWVTRAKLDAS